MATETPSPPASSASAQARLLAVVSSLVTELGGREGGVALDSDLERDLGLGSLERVELVTRLEEAFGRALPDEVALGARTPRELLTAVGSAAGVSAASLDLAAAPAPAAAAPSPVFGAPEGVATLLDVARYRAETAGENTYLRLLADDLTPSPLTYGDLWHRALRVAGGLAGLRVSAGDRVGLVLPTCLDFFPAFLGILAAGAVPVPIYPPMRLDDLEGYAGRQAAILSNAGIVALVSDGRLLAVAELLAARVARGRGTGRGRTGRRRPAVTTVSRLLAEPARKARRAVPAARAAPDDLALIQYTSGSTGDPKGVALTHANLLANVRAIGETIELGPTDVAVSWLPLYHDMGLIGAWFTTYFYGVPLVLLSPLQFLSRPERWLWAFHRFRGTASAAPNFAFELCLRRVRDEDVRGLDLSSWRYAMNGAEPVWPETLERFAARFAPYGFRREALHPAYGLAENAVALTLPPLGRGPRYDRVDREALVRDRRALPLPDGRDGLTFVSCGRPLPGCEVRVVEPEADPEEWVERGCDLPERGEGRILFRGPSAMQGYFGRPEATAALRRGGWTDTGDLGYFADGELFVTGRTKDVVIKGGRKYHPQDIERAAAGVAGVRKGCVAAFDAPSTGDEGLGGEAIVVVAETREPPVRHPALVRDVVEAVAAAVGTPADRVELVPPGTLPKTSSGKLRRREARERFLTGTLRRPAPRGRKALLGLSLGSAAALAASLASRAVRSATAATFGRVARGLFGLYAFVTGVVVVLPMAALALAVCPTQRSAWRFVRRALRLAGRLTGLLPELTFEGGADPASIAEGPLVAVSNHASYLDVLALMATLDRPLAFTAKREVFGWPLVGPFARRIGAISVERRTAGERLEAFGAAAEAAGAGQAIHVFPEATFSPATGLLPFRLGAFRLAAEQRLPVVPIALAGTRRALPSGARLPRPARLQVRVLAPVEPPPESEGFRALAGFRDRVRQALASELGEPLLSAPTPPGTGRSASDPSE